MKIAIIGSRTFVDEQRGKERINKILTDNNILVNEVISGGAKGADSIAEIFAKENNIPITIFKPDWSIGRHAGLLRNSQIIDECDVVIALWDGKSNGTKDSIKKAEKSGKKVFIVNF